MTTTAPRLESVLTCPVCGHAKRELMPTDACQFFYDCERCRTVLRPKAGGVAFVMGAMGDVLDAVLDVTLAYDPPRPTLAELFSNRVRTVRVHLQLRPLPEGAAGSDYENDPVFRAAFQAWLNDLWAEKDARLAAWESASVARD